MWLMDGMPQDISVRVILAVLMATFLPPIDVAGETYSNQTFESFRDAAILYPDAELIGEATTHLSAVRSVINWTELPTGCLDSETSFKAHCRRLAQPSKAARRQAVQERVSFAELCFQAAGIDVTDGLMAAIRQVPPPPPPPRPKVGPPIFFSSLVTCLLPHTCCLLIA